MSTTENMRPKKRAPKHKGHTRSKQERRDDSIMNTNDSSIVSKRSVSKLYFPDEPDFYEPFVQKYMRRNPLINRGYWLRMHAIEQVVRQFLEEDSEKSKIIVNLGCGYDPLPFQFWHRYASISKNVTFVDVDYPQLIGRKRDRILTNTLLREALLQTNLRSSEAPVYLRSDRYMALGCDLRDINTLERALKAELNLASSSLLFVAEVSLTYMATSDSDLLIQWASTLDDSRFCILEQYLPQGADHPFAQTMLRHFHKLQTHIHAVEHYPSLNQQSSRFTHAGWSTINIARNLWDLWSDETFTPPSIRCGLDAVEPFDEWEEFALFAGHYFLLVASNAETRTLAVPTIVDTSDRDALTTRGEGRSMTMIHYETSSHLKLVPRRFGVAFTLGQKSVAFHGGQGLQSRLASIDVLGREAPESTIQPCLVTVPQARMCHTVTPIDGCTALLVGGRTSPTQALADCWTIKHGAWQQVHDIIPARFRHASVRVTWPSSDGRGLTGVLVFGGKTSNGTVLDEWTLWTPSQGWQTVNISGVHPSARFGATVATMGSAQDWGYIVGGMDPSGAVLDQIWEWHATAATHPQLNFIDRTNDICKNSNALTWGRLGAHLVAYEDSLLLIGGISKTDILGQSDNFLALSHDLSSLGVHFRNVNIVLPNSIWPLLVGAGAVAVSQDEIVVAGGGAVCFSMGSYWNEGYFTITAGKTVPQLWTVLVSRDTEEAKTGAPTSHFRVNGKQGKKTGKSVIPKPALLPRVQLRSPENFVELLTASKPAIIESLDTGPCLELWTLEYLKERIGADRQVVIHECDSDRMTFKEKNFQYVKKPFGAFIDGILAGSKTYLRAVSSTQPNKLPTRLEDDFPTIASDFKLPEVFRLVEAGLHSSPLRISGPVALWLHYDVLANVLCQIRGSKTLYLYPPSDVRYLSYPPGGSSSNVDVLTSTDPTLRRTHPHIASLKPGDILFIPPMWSHTAIPEEGVSVAVNVFFKNLDNGYAAGKDVYGNRDLQAYENGRRDVERIAKAFKNIPDDLAKFYLDRLAAELQEKADRVGGTT